MGRASRHRRATSRFLLAVVAIAVAPACNTSNGGVPTAPGGPTIPTIGGTYSSSTMWRFELTSEAAPITFVCAGSITIANQLGDRFSGSFLINDQNCGFPLPGSVVDGVFGTDGSVTFGLTITGPDSNLLTAAFGCTYESGDRGVRGTLIGTQLQAQARTVMDCPQSGRAELVTNIAGSR